MFREREIKRGTVVAENVPEDPKPTPSRKSRSRSIHSSRSIRSTASKSVQPVNKFMEKENMVVSAITKKNRKVEKQESVSENESAEEDYTQVVGSKDQTEATKAAKILGDNTMNKIFSRKYDRRREGIKETKRQMMKSTPDNARPTLDAVAFVLSKTLKDSLFSVYGAALDLLRSCVLDFMPKHNLLQQAGKLADATVNHLLAKLSSTATDKRIPQATEEVLLELMLSDPKVCKAFVPRLLSSSPTVKKAEIVSTVAEHYDAPNHTAGISEETLRNYAGNCLASSQHEVRSCGRQLILLRKRRPASSTECPANRVTKGLSR